MTDWRPEHAVMRACPQCHGPIAGRPRKKFCSQACSNANRRRPNARKRGRHEVGVCSLPGCGKPCFAQGRQVIRKFCSMVCANIAQRVERPCPVCSGAMRGRQGVTCSRRCAAVYFADVPGKRMHAPEMLAKVRMLWDDGMPTQAIGNALHVTKSTVIGIAHRHGFPARPSPIKGRVSAERKPRPRQFTPFNAPLQVGAVALPPLASIAPVEAVRKPVAPPVPRPREKAPEPAQPGQRVCEWLTGDGPFVRCGDTAVSGYPYCERHCRVAYIGWPLKRTAESLWAGAA